MPARSVASRHKLRWQRVFMCLSAGEWASSVDSMMQLTSIPVVTKTCSASHPLHTRLLEHAHFAACCDGVANNRRRMLHSPCNAKKSRLAQDQTATKPCAAENPGTRQYPPIIASPVTTVSSRTQSTGLVLVPEPLVVA